jgi:hypothetical protein
VASGSVFLLAHPEFFYSHLASWRVVIRSPDKLIKIGNKKFTKSPWFDKECAEKKRRANALLRKYRNKKNQDGFVL